MDEKLIKYVEHHLRKGSDLGLVQQNLINAGHDARNVQSHIRHAIQNKRVKDYVEKHSKAGFELEKIKDVLIRAGHDSGIVERHVTTAMEKKRKRKALGIAFICAICLVIAAFLSNLLIGNFSAQGDDEIKAALNEAVDTRQSSINSFNEALIKNDIVACEEVSDLALKDACRAKLSGNSSQDSQNNESLVLRNDRETFNRALTLHNQTICMEIIDAGMKIQCQQVA